MARCLHQANTVGKTRKSLGGQNRSGKKGQNRSFALKHSAERQIINDRENLRRGEEGPVIWDQIQDALVMEEGKEKDSRSCSKYGGAAGLSAKKH